MTSVVDAPGQVTVVGLEAMLETRFPEIRVPDSWSWWDAPLRDNARKAQRRRVRHQVASITSATAERDG